VEYAFDDDLRKLPDVERGVKAVVPPAALAHVRFDASWQNCCTVSVNSAKMLFYDALPVGAVCGAVFDPDAEHIDKVVSVLALQLAPVSSQNGGNVMARPFIFRNLNSILFAIRHFI
jgi:hypothetical protein